MSNSIKDALFDADVSTSKYGAFHLADVIALAHHEYVKECITDPALIIAAMEVAKKLTSDEHGSFPQLKFNETDKKVALEIIDFFSMTVGQNIIEGKGSKFDSYIAGALSSTWHTAYGQDIYTLSKLPQYYYDRLHKVRFYERVAELDSQHETPNGLVSEVITIGYVSTIKTAKDGVAESLFFKYINENGNVVSCYTIPKFQSTFTTEFIRPGAVIKVRGQYSTPLLDERDPNNPRWHSGEFKGNKENRLHLSYIGPVTVNLNNI